MKMREIKELSDENEGFFLFASVYQKENTVTNSSRQVRTNNTPQSNIT